MQQEHDSLNMALMQCKTELQAKSEQWQHEMQVAEHDKQNLATQIGILNSNVAEMKGRLDEANQKYDGLKIEHVTVGLNYVAIGTRS